MATVQEKLAESLKVLQTFQDENGFAVIKSSVISKVHLGRLVDNGFLQEVMRGWYISARPDVLPGDTTNWYTSFWYFIAEYSRTRFGENWCLTPEQSLVLHSGNMTVPVQVIIRSPKASNNVAGLLHNTSLLDIKTPVADNIVKEPVYGLNLYSLPEALIESSPDSFRLDSITARICLSMIPDSSDILGIILEKGQTTKAGRLAGAFRNIGNTSIADEIVSTMKSLGHDIREDDPFEDKAVVPFTRSTSPYAARLRLMWEKMRPFVIGKFPLLENTHTDVDACMKHLDEKYKLDAYHSLSIEGYKVTDELIEKVRSGNWKPDSDSADSEQKQAMAARGYFQAFEKVKESIVRILNGENAGSVAEKNHRLWYRELFGPSVAAGLIKTGDLAGYRNHQVYIRGSRHTPLKPQAVRDAMPVLFELLENESEASVRAVLGHFFFAYIHPYMDGNGRMARFLMNTQLISGGYDWVVVPVERRAEYMQALEKASIEDDITDFTQFIVSLIDKPLGD